MHENEALSLSIGRRKRGVEVSGGSDNLTETHKGTPWLVWVDIEIMNLEAKWQDGKDSQHCPEVGEMCGKDYSFAVSVRSDPADTLISECEGSESIDCKRFRHVTAAPLEHYLPSISQWEPAQPCAVVPTPSQGALAASEPQPLLHRATGFSSGAVMLDCSLPFLSVSILNSSWVEDRLNLLPQSQILENT